MRPGRTLYRLAAIFVSEHTCKLVIEPLLADFQHEWSDARAAKRPITLLRGYAAFWRTFGTIGVQRCRASRDPRRGGSIGHSGLRTLSAGRHLGSNGIDFFRDSVLLGRYATVVGDVSFDTLLSWPADAGESGRHIDALLYVRAIPALDAGMAVGARLSNRR